MATDPVEQREKRTAARARLERSRAGLEQAINERIQAILDARAVGVRWTDIAEDLQITDRGAQNLIRVRRKRGDL